MMKSFVWIFAAIASLNICSAFADNQEEEVTSFDEEQQEVAVIEDDAADISE